MDRFFSHGKLLLTSEYVILDGALALALPTKQGQEMFFDSKEAPHPFIYWESLCQKQAWLNLKIDPKNWKILETNDKDAGRFILKILKTIQNLSPNKFSEKKAYYFKSNLEFQKNFGLGSSSTLIHNLAQWVGIDAYQLNELILGGSGYDIAVAKTSSPILYEIKNTEKNIQKIDFSPPYKDDLIFVYLNQKQNSREGIQLYHSKTVSKKIIDDFSQLTKKIIACKNIDEFSKIMALHEQKISEFLELKTSKELHFVDCPVFIKSLGAWGGDFVLSRKFDGYEDYFHNKGFHIIFTWNEIILNS